MTAGLKFGAVRMRTNDRVIAKLVEADGVLDACLEVADDISAETKASTSGSRRLAQFGKKMVTDKTDTGARAGTTWGPAVPVEFGTFRTPPLRILTGIAERRGGKVGR